MTASVSLGEICQFMGGGTPPRKTKEYWNGDIPWATVKDFKSDRISETVEYISRDGLENSASKVVPSGTVLLVTRVGLGKVAVADTDVAINQDIKAVLPSKDVLPEFLLWALKNLGPKIEAKGTGATVKGVTLRDIREMQIPLPSLDEQRRIVDILNRAARIEQLRSQAADRLREFISALFIKMFGDPIDNPNEWDVSILGDIIQGFQSGKNIRAGNGESKFRILKVSAVTGGIFNPFMSKPAPSNYIPPKDHFVHAGDLLISRANTSSLVGATAIVEHEAPYVLLPDKIWRFVWCNNSVIEPAYLHSLLKTSSMRATLSAMATGTSGSMKNISQSRLKTLPILIPPLSLQRRFVDIAMMTRSIRSLSKFSSMATSTLSISLMNGLLRERA